MPEHKIINEALSKIFAGIAQLRNAVPGKQFTIDGRLVGDIGEVLVQRDYDVALYPIQVAGYDGETSDGRRVQIKATFQNSLTFTSIPDYYIGLKINEHGIYEEIFNGPGQVIADAYSHRQGIGERLLSFPISVLAKLSEGIEADNRIPRRE